MSYPRIPRLFMALGFAIALVATPQFAEAQQKHGDVSADGIVSALDAQAILSAVVGLGLPPSFVLSNGVADCLSGRTVPAALDAQIVLSFVIGLQTSQFCVGQTFGPGATTISLTLPDTSLLINRKLQVRAVLKDGNGFLIERPVTWQTSNADLVSVDSARGDTAWVSNRFATTGAADASATISAFADGTLSSLQIKVFRSYAGIVITPQRPDTLRQLNGVTNYSTRLRDSLGVLGAFTNAFWTTENPSIATVTPTTATNTGAVTALTTGTSFLYAVSQSNPAVKDSVRLNIALPALNACTGQGGTLHPTATFTTAQTWSPATNPHYVTGTLTFNSGSRLTVEPGTLVCTNSSSWLVFRDGSRMTALGTVTQPIAFKPTTPTDTWSGIQLGDFGSGAPIDTSEIRNTTFERVNNGNGAVSGRERHVVMLDSVRIRESGFNAITLMAPGSRMIRGTIDTITSGSTFNHAAILGRASLEETTIRVGGIASGVQVLEAATLRQLTIVGGTTAITQNSGTDSARINDVMISGTSGVALQMDGGLLHPASGNVQITSGTGGGFRGNIGNLGRLFSDSVKQGMLKGLGKDTIFITGGSLQGVTLVARPDLPWFVSQIVTIDTLAQLAPRPGAQFIFNFGGFTFQQGGTLDARGEATKFIRFRPTQGGWFYGLLFHNPGGGPNPATRPTATSQLSFVQLDSAQGNGTPEGGICCAAAINAGDRHRLIIDSAIVRKSAQGAVFIAAANSELKRSVIDTTGTIESNFVASYVAVGLGDSTVMQNSLVRRSGNVGVDAPFIRTRLQNVRIVGSTGVGLRAEGGLLVGDLGSVRVDSANAYAYRGTIQNLAVLAPDSVSQANSFLPVSGPGNVDSRLEISGSTLVGTGAAPVTLTAIPQLPWMVFGNVTIDTLAQLAPRPSARIGFWNAGFLFQRGGILNAIGEAGKNIQFRPWQGNVVFNGMTFQDPGPGVNPALAPTAISQMSFVRLDSATGSMGTTSNGICCQAAINAGVRHRLLIDSIVVHKAEQGAIWLGAPNSTLARAVIDTTGPVTNGFAATYVAVVLGTGVTMQNSLVRRAGNTAVNASGSGAQLQNVRIVGSLGVGLQAEGGLLAGDLASVRVDSANAYAYRGTIQNLAILAPDSASQANSFLPVSGPGNTNNRLEISNSTLVGTGAAPVTLTTIPQLPWLVFGNVTIDTLAQLAPRPSSQIGFWNAGFLFQRGGILNAIGEAGKNIQFRPWQSNVTFNGMTFQDPGPGVNPALAPTAISQMSFVRFDSATGSMGTTSNGYCCQAAVNAGVRHRLLIDSIVVHKAEQGAIWLGAPNSIVDRALVDTTGPVANGFTATYVAVALGNDVTMRNSLVRRSGAVGLFSNGTARLQNVRVVGSKGVGLQAESGLLQGDLGSVRIDSANAYAYRGTIQNLAVLAPDSTTQANSFLPVSGPGNVDSRLEISTGTLVGTGAAPVTLTTIPQLPWLVFGNVTIDTLAQLAPRPSATFNFLNAGFLFQRGGTLNALGEAGKTIRFKPSAGNVVFNGMTFQDPGAGVNPALAPTAVSQMNFVRIDSATGSMGTTSNGFCCQAAINAGVRHRLLIDSIFVHKAEQGAIWLGARQSVLSRALIDTTGPLANGFVATYVAVALGDSVRFENSLVRRAGTTGVYANGAGVRLQNVRIVASLGVGLQAEGGVLDASSVRADSANAYAFRGKIQNLAILAPDSATQANSFLPPSGPGNSSSRLEIAPSTLTGSINPLTLTAIPQLPWLVFGNVTIDTLAQLAPRPSATLTFQNAGILFQRGGTLSAIGEANKFISLRPSASNAQFNGLSFSNQGGTGTIASQLSFVRLDSITGNVGNPGGTPFCCQSAIWAADRHQLSLDSVVVHKAEHGAIWMAAGGSSVNRSVVDTTGVAPGYTASYQAVSLNENTTATNLVVRRSGHVGIYLDGTGITLTGTRVVNSRLTGIQIGNNQAGPVGSQGLVLSGFTVDSTGGVGVSIEASDVRLADCDALNGMSHGFATSASLTGVRINDCNIENNGRSGTGLGVSNFNVGPAPPNSFAIDANNNFWGYSGGPGTGITPAVGAVNGVSANVSVPSVRPDRRVP